MRILVASEAHLFRDHDGRIRNASGTAGYAFWRRYLDVFDEVLVAARTRASAEDRGAAADDAAVVEGEGVRVAALPDYRGPWGYLAAYPALRAALRDAIVQADVLCLRAPGPVAGAAWRLRAGRPFGLEVVGDPHDTLAPGSIRSIARPLARALLSRDLARMCREAEAVAYVTTDALQRRYPTAAFATSYSSIDLHDDAFVDEASLRTRVARESQAHKGTAADPWRLIFVGTLAQLYKGPDVLLDAVALARERGLAVDLTIVGDGSHRSALVSRAAALGLDAHVRFVGHVPAGAPVRELLDGADLFVLPSRGEGLPRAMIEAMARGVPAVGTDVSGIPELLPPERLVPRGNVRALTEAITRLCSPATDFGLLARRDRAVARTHARDVLRPRRREFYRALRASAAFTDSAAIEGLAGRTARPGIRAVRNVPTRSAVRTSLRHNAGWALAGNVGYAACQFGILAAIAKLTTAAEVGRFALALALTAPVISLTNLNLRAVQATDARGEYTFSAYLGLRLVTTMLALLAVAGIALGVGYKGATLSLILVVALAKAFESLSDVVFGRLQRAENLRRVAVSMLAKGVCSIVTVGVLLYVTGNLLVAALGLASCWALVFLAYDFPAVVPLESVLPRFDHPTLLRLGSLALPVGVLTALTSLVTNIPRYDIEANLGATALGHFSAIAYLVLALSQPVLALGTAVSPRLAQYFVLDRRAYRRLSRRTILLAGILGCMVVAAAIVLGRTFLALAYTPEYAAHYALLVWIALATAVLFLNSALGYAVTAARHFREQTGIAVFALVVCAVTSHLAVPRFGLVGASWAVLATEVARGICLAAVYCGLCSTGSAPAPGAVHVETPRAGVSVYAS